MTNPFGGVKASGPGARLGGAQANIDAFTQTQWVTMRSELPQYPIDRSAAERAGPPPAAMTTVERTQVAIIGAGPAGLLLSHLLAAPASIRSCSRTAAATTWSIGSARACWSSRRSIC